MTGGNVTNKNTKKLVKKDSRGRQEIWEWEETPELKKFIERNGTINSDK